MVLNNQSEARGFYSECHEAEHMTWKELKAVRLAVQTVLPHLVGIHILLYEDNQAVCYI
jgi:hypothetical protein